MISIRSTGIDFKTAVQGISRAEFLVVWNEVRRRRNDFIHGNPYALRIGVAEKAFDLAVRATNTFALVQNNYAIVPWGRARRHRVGIAQV